MRRIFQTFVDRLIESTDSNTLRQSMAEIVTALDLCCFAYLSMPSDSKATPLLISTYPSSWTAHYLQHHYERHDPVITKALREPQPFKWGLGVGPSTLSESENKLFEEAASFGIRFGFTIPIHDRVFTEEIAEMHRLRWRVFKERPDWDVQISRDMEIDEFDALRPAYLIQRASDGPVRGCVRLLPSTGPTMLRETFPMLLDGVPAPASPAIWESSRFALDLDPGIPKTHGLAVATYELFAGMIEFGLSRHLSEIVTVTDARMERILRRAGWPLRRIGKPCALGSTLAVAGYLETSIESLARVRMAGGVRGPVLWAPVAQAAA
jgi:acyl homoserine lactone synthase